MRTFVDTNVLVYALSPSSPFHTTANRVLAERSQAGDSLVISSQVLREFAAAVSRPQPHGQPMPKAQLLSSLADLRRTFEVVHDGPGVLDEFVRLLGQVNVGGAQVHDANLVATMLAHGIDELLTGNREDFDRFAAWIKVTDLAAGSP